MIRNRFSRAVFKAVAIIILLTPALQAQVGYYFGQNKVRYKDFDWKVYRTEHFDVYYYNETDITARDAARMAERGYAYLSKTLGHNVKDRIPLILYASLNDFAQTNVINGLLDQGTRGVTESLKNRVTLPITGSYREFNHVLVHELVHAFQYDIMFNNELNITRFNPPLWFVEGMAEYLSAGMDNTTRMWVRDGLIHDDLMSVQKLNGTYDIRVYRLGQSLWHYIGENYGKEMVGKIFKMAARSGNVERAIKSYLNMDLKQLTTAWHTYAKSLTVPADTTMAMPADVAQQLTHRGSYYHRMNIAPAVSPDGKRVAYVANKDLDEEIYMLTQKPDGSYEQKHLISGGKSRQFETLRYFETAMGWSRDGKKLAFISKSGAKDVIYIVDSHSGKVLQEFQFERLNGLLSPTFSPEGERLVFAGLQGGISDLYLLNLGNGNLRRLTNDKFATLHPQWGPENEIVFITDRGKNSNAGQLLFSDYDLAIYNLSDNTIQLVTDLPGSETSPQWSPDGSEIAFISDYEGIPNIYRIRLNDGEIRRLTALKSGVSGITETTPAFSWSANGNAMVFSAFVDASWQLFKVNPDDLVAEIPVSPEKVSENAGKNAAIAISVTTEALPDTAKKAQKTALEKRIFNTFPTEEETPDSAVTVQIDNQSIAVKDSVINTAPMLATAGWLPEIPDINTIYTGYELSPDDSVETRDYSSNFKLDAVQVGGGYNTFFGVQGGAAFLFSDMLGNHTLYLSSELQFSDPRYSDFGLTYFNQANRWSWGVQAFQSSLSYLTAANFNQVGLIRDTYRGFNGLVAYPFSKFARLELTGGITWINEDFVVETYNFSGLDRETTDIGTFNYGLFSAAMVFDHSTYGPLGPSKGYRSRFSVETTTNDIQSTTLLADYRKYFRTSNRTVLAWRFMGAGSVGKDDRFFDIGGPYYYRGADYNELIGSNFLLSNLEFRFPMLPFLPPTMDFLSGAAFADAAGAWGINSRFYDNPTFQPFSNENGFRLNDLNAAVGLAARLNIGYFLLQYELAWPTDLQNFGSPVKRFSIGTFF
ncbi:MAG: PD40 domain-containing protein [Calditrichaeota bacterium]|nr:PD40 domain-containing protein [Calditrichota bacterium]